MSWTNGRNMSQLRMACERGDSEEVAYPLAISGENFQNREGETPLHIASKHGNLDTIKVLLSRAECNLHTVDRKDNTPLHYACKNGHHSTVEFLVADQRCQLNTQNGEGETPLYLASKYGPVDTVKVLVSRKECDLNIPDNKGNTPLHTACKHGHLSTVECFAADKRCQLDTKNREGDTPLHIACHVKALSIIRLLLEKECNTTIPNKKGETAEEIPLNEDGDCLLHIACQWGDAAIVRYLVTYERWNPNVTNPSNIAPLHTACKHNHLGAVKALVARKECDLNTPGENGNTPLHTACEHGHHTIVEFLAADQRCQLNSKNMEGETPFHIACRMKALSVIRLLLQRECSPNIPTKKGETAQEIPLSEDGDYLLHFACQWGDVAIVRYLITNERCNPNVTNLSNSTPLHTASKHNHLGVVKVLVGGKECDLNIPGENGNTPLHTAAKHGHYTIVKFLAAYRRCQLNIQNSDGETPLHIVSNHGDLDTIKVLTSREECNLNIPDEQGNTPLHRASKCSHNSVVEFLTAKSDLRCKLNTQNGEGETPLYLASKYGPVDSVKVLVSRKECDLNIPDNKGNTPLHTACKHGHLSTVEVLVADLRCQLNAQNGEGKTPLHVASQHDNLGSIKALIHRRKCNPNISDEKGNTPLHTACKHDHCSIVEFLVADQMTSTISERNTQKRGHLSTVEFPAYDQRCQLKLNPKNREGDTPLHIACHVKSFSIIRLLLQKKCSTITLNKKRKTADGIPLNEDGDYLLHIACQWGDVAIVRYLITDARCNPNVTNVSNSTPLHTASEHNHLGVVKVLVGRKECDLNIPGENGNTPLHTAAKYGHHTIVEFLVADQRCQLNTQNREGDTPLHIACHMKALSIIRLLLQKKGIHSTNIPNKKGETALEIPLNEDGDYLLHIACQWGDVAVVKYLITVERCNPNVTNPSNIAPLHTASKHNHLGVVKVLVGRKECDLNIPGENGNTPLHTAAKHGHYTIVEFLVADQGCQLDIQNSEGETPLHIVSNHGDLDTIKVLTRREQCNLNIVDKNGNIPLHSACKHGHRSTVEFLVTDQRCQLNTQNREGETPLHIACHMKTLSIVKLLLEKRCSTNIPNKKGETAQEIPLNEDGDYLLHVACKWGDVDMIRYLINKQMCDANVPNKHDLTPLLATISRGEPSVATALLQHAKCDLSLRDKDGNTALHLACISGQTHPEMIKVAKHLIIYVDPLCVNNAGQTPIEHTTNYELIQSISHFTKCKTKHSVQTYVNLFIVGNPETGKSTLVKAVCKEANTLWKIVPKVFRRVKNVQPHTAGIIPTAFRSKTFGNTVLYDLAGQIEYYTSHAAVIQTTVISTPPAFIIVVNMSESEEKISETLRYWWSFVNNHAARASAPPQVILVGSHADKVKARGGRVQQKMSQVSALLKRLPTSFRFAGQVAIDCRDTASSQLRLFCTLVNNSCAELRQTADVDLRCHVLYAFLLDKFPGNVACTVSDVATIIQESDALLPQNPDRLIPLISTLNDKGLLLLVRDSGSSEDSWVILQKQALLGEINGTIFAPKDFSEHKDLSSSTGVVPSSKLRCKFPHYNPNMIAKFLLHLEFCFKLHDHETLELLKDEVVHEENMPQSRSEEYYFFPALVSVENPLQVWKQEQDDVMICQCAWLYRCVRQDQFLTTQFLHVLILRLAFSFALQFDPGDSHEDSLALHRRCSVWKRGIGWLNRVPIETVVEVGLLNQSVIVMMRCPKGEEAKCAQLRSEIIQKVLQARDEHCKAVRMSESFIHPNDVKYPFIDNAEDFKCYSLTEIARATVKDAPNVLDYGGRNPFPMKDVLLFDPYCDTSMELLSELFSEKHSLDEQVRDEVLRKLSEGEAGLSCPPCMNRIANTILFVYLPVYAAIPQYSLGQETVQEAHGGVPRHCESGVAYNSSASV